jgi:hypothetical protein
MGCQPNVVCTSFIDYLPTPTSTLVPTAAPPDKMRLLHGVRIQTVYQTQYRTKEASKLNEGESDGDRYSHPHGQIVKVCILPYQKDFYHGPRGNPSKSHSQCDTT